MMKFTKMTHLSIIVVLAIMFVVVYLYYTISDVKKIHNEVSKLTQDIEKMNQSITNITTTIIPFLSNGPLTSSNYPDVFTQQDASNHASLPLPIHQQPSTPDMPFHKQGKIQDDVSSVDSQELNTIMETIDDESPLEEPVLAKALDITQISTSVSASDEPIEDGNTLAAHEGVVDLSTLSLEDLKKVSYEDIRKYCKSNNISYKGSKDVLIYRIKGVTA